MKIRLIMDDNCLYKVQIKEKFFDKWNTIEESHSLLEITELYEKRKDQITEKIIFYENKKRITVIKKETI